MVQQSRFSFSLLFLFLHCSTKILAQAPAAAPVVQPPPAAPVKAPPAPPAQAPSGVQIQPSPGPLDVVKILGKASHFTVLVRLLKATQVDTELFLQLNNTNNGATIFAPTDGAFSGLKVGTLNSLSDGEKIELVKFHIVPTFISSSQFQTVSNPVRTLAGAGHRFALNVTTGGSTVNITTGLTNTTISGTVYTDTRLAIYQVDRVLLPLDIFTPKPPAPAPSPAALAPEKSTKAPIVESPVAPKDLSASMSLFMQNNVVFLAAGIVCALIPL
ncbi:fasciclin-like arabinogalactan protein 12 [Ricinus communis]|uniref:fasciclin-like arabinogalactan protein 12 n=1 Tax=Ricinus communis TaxID=3988 RepID=UPI00201B1774|nr:fasciclin-like arabinogalactan protein 12 [Ricinus communis]